jgi:hypothetical protein
MRGCLMDKKILEYEIGKPFPGMISQQQGCFMELWESLMVIIQMPGLRRQEVMAFKKSFKRYSYLESPGSIPIAFFMFDFPAPINLFDLSFNSCACTQDSIDDYFAKINGKTSNVVTFFLLDQNIIRAIKPFGLHHKAVELFHATIKKQREMNYSQNEYDKCLSDMYKYSGKKLYDMGTEFKTKRIK